MNPIEIERILNANKTQALCLWPSWPLRGDSDEVGHLGGRPKLPNGVDWPRTGGDAPLHFLAMVNCSKLQDPFNRLPTHGALFFFGLANEDGAYEEDDMTRVLYFEEIGQDPVAPPEDAIPVMGGYDHFSMYLGLEEDVLATEFNRWPLEQIILGDWPDLEMLPAAERQRVQDAGYDEQGNYPYSAEVQRRRQSQLPIPDAPSDPNWVWPRGQLHKNSGVTLAEICSRPQFPFAYAFVENICRNYEHSCERQLKDWEPNKDRLPDPAQLSEKQQVQQKKQAAYMEVIGKRVQVSQKLRRNAVAKGLANTIAGAERDEFLSWLTYESADDLRHGWDMKSAYEKGMRSTLLRLGSYPELVDKIPRELFAEFPVTAHHQMFGFGHFDYNPSDADAEHR